MPSRPLLAASAATLAAAGVVILFLPQELLAALDLAPAPPLPALLQVIAALLLGFASLDWMSRGVRHGGIYGRPLVLANVTAFSIAGLSLLRDASSSAVIAAGAVCVVLGAGFCSLLFGGPR